MRKGDGYLSIFDWLMAHRKDGAVHVSIDAVFLYAYIERCERENRPATLAWLAGAMRLNGPRLARRMKQLTANGLVVPKRENGVNVYRRVSHRWMVAEV